jgi:hypothetical protein
MKTICSNYDVRNDILFRQEDKDCHQVKMWPPTPTISHQINSSEFWLIKGGICHAFRNIGF